MSTDRDRASTSVLALALLTGACALPTKLGELPADGGDTIEPTESGLTESGLTGGPTSGATTGATSMPPTSGTEDSGMVAPLPMHAYVMRYDDWLAAVEAAGGGADDGLSDGGIESDTATGSEPTPDDLVVQLSTGPDSCADPLALDECSGQWQIFMRIPPELQVPGTYGLFSELSATIAANSPPDSGGCGGGGGSLEGMATLTVVSEQEVRGTVSPLGLEIFGIDFGMDFDFVALGCG